MNNDTALRRSTVGSVNRPVATLNPTAEPARRQPGAQAVSKSDTGDSSEQTDWRLSTVVSGPATIDQ